MFKIGIIGAGVTGGNLIKWFRNHTSHVIKIYDPALGHKDNLKDCEAAFICVPADTRIDGTQDLSIVEESVLRTNGQSVFIRSTVFPGTNDSFGTKSMPEFLTERRAYLDLVNQGTILTAEEDQLFLENLFPGKSFLIMKNLECEIAKYVHNSFAALKVNYFNGIQNLCEGLKIDYQKVLEGTLMSHLISKEHTQVPGPDGQFGFGGKCLPKDTKAFVHFLKIFDNLDHLPYRTLKETLEQNKLFRNEKE